MAAEISRRWVSFCAILIVALAPLASSNAGRSDATEISFVGVHAVQRVDKVLLRVEFRAITDLREIPNKDAILFLHSFFCSHKNDVAVLNPPTVYLDDLPLRRSYLDPSRKDLVYSFYIFDSRKEHLDAKPIEVGFDLRSAPEDICFYVTGHGSFGTFYRSQIATIPALAISDAFRQLGNQ
jgi:hypothetical protein